jgi:hypothetical protein
VLCCTRLKWAVNKKLEGSGKKTPTKSLRLRLAVKWLSSKNKPVEKTLKSAQD